MAPRVSAIPAGVKFFSSLKAGVQALTERAQKKHPGADAFLHMPLPGAAD
jgi:hypothetical protein